MSSTVPKGRTNSTLRKFLDNEASGGLVLMAVAFIAIVVANSPLAETYFHLLHVYIGPLSLQHWVNDALMAVFFLLVGLEIKREMLDGQLSSWSRRIQPGAGAAAAVHDYHFVGRPRLSHQAVQQVDDGVFFVEHCADDRDAHAGIIPPGLRKREWLNLAQSPDSFSTAFNRLYRD